MTKQRIRRLVSALLVCCCFPLVLAGCWDATDLENITLALTVGLDVDKDRKHLYVYVVSPIFSKEAKENEERHTVFARSLKNARNEIDAVATSMIVSGKIQTILIGKRLAEQPGWIQLLDTLYRDAKATANARIIMVDGEVENIISFRPKDKPRLSVFLPQLLDTAENRNITQKITLQDLYRDWVEKGETAIMSAIKFDKKVILLGTALLSQRGEYAETLGLTDTGLLCVLENKLNSDFNMTLTFPALQQNRSLPVDTLSFFIRNPETKIRPSLQGDRVRFQVEVKTEIAISERTFPFPAEEQGEELKKRIEKELEEKFAQLIKRCQEKKVDPFGFGERVRAYEYPAWKKMKDDWPTHFSKADVDVSVSVTITGNGIMQ